MKNVSILVPESSVLQAIDGPQYLFSSVNRFLEAAGKKPLFEVQLVGVKPELKLSNGLYTVHPHALLHQVQQTDLIIIPALFGGMPAAVEANRAFIPWLVDQYHRGAEVASICVGAFLLASTGLLHGKKCSTHWGFLHQFRQMFPEVTVVDGSIVTEEDRLYSSGGANSYWNLLLHLVEKYTDRETAILASKYFAIDIDRSSQAAFALFQGQKNHPDAAIKEAQEFIEHNFCDKITVEQLAARSAIGRRSFERRFVSATNNSVLEYMQRVRVEAAKRSFETSRKNIGEVMYEVGYTDTKAFRTIFKKITGLTPVAYRKKYSKSAAKQALEAIC